MYSPASASNANSAFSTIPENYINRSYSSQDSQKYATIVNQHAFHDQTRTNLNSSHEFLQQSHTANSYNFTGTPIHSKSYNRSFSDHTNGNINYDSGTHLQHIIEKNISVHNHNSDNFQSRTNDHLNTNNSLLRNPNNVLVDQNSSGAFNKSQNNSYEPTKINNGDEKNSTPNHNQSDEKLLGLADGWREERGPLYFQQSTDSNVTAVSIK